MNKRIRYVADATGKQLISMQVIKSESGAEYKVTLEENKFSITNLTAATTSAWTIASSPHKAKIAAKKELTALGCTFAVETRKARSDGNK